MRSRFAYFYLMKDEPHRIPITVPRHVSYWRELSLPGYVGGPFEDRSGGLITFDTEDRGAAELAVHTDPFVREGLLDAYWLKEWTPE
jgi:uncharacterized protein YciI